MAEFEFFTDPVRFRAATAELVDRDPVGATMLSGVLSGVLAGPAAAPAPGGRPLMGRLVDRDGSAVAVLRTPPYPMLVAVDPELRDVPGALRAVADAVVGSGEPVAGFQGRREVVRELAQVWTERAGVTPRPRIWLLLHRLGDLVVPPNVPGTPRPLTADDPTEVALLVSWLDRFGRETGMAREGAAPDADFVLRSVGRGMVYTMWWHEAVPVSVAGHGAVGSDGGCRIAPVYTPPDRRRERFGAAATVAAVRSAWAHGATEVTLFTDEDYRPSNELYRSLGFEPIAEFAEFDVPAG